jgi:hypothetical protein
MKKEYSGPNDQKSSPWYDFILFRALETKLMKKTIMGGLLPKVES